MLKSEVKDYIKKENLIAWGDTRAVYRAEDKVIKVNLSNYGYLKTKNEDILYKLLEDKIKKGEIKLDNLDFLNKVLEFNELYSVSNYLKAPYCMDYNIHEYLEVKMNLLLKWMNLIIKHIVLLENVLIIIIKS